MGLGLERVLNSFLFNAGGVDIAYAIVVPSLLVVMIDWPSLLKNALQSAL